MAFNNINCGDLIVENANWTLNELLEIIKIKFANSANIATIKNVVDFFGCDEEICSTNLVLTNSSNKINSEVIIVETSKDNKNLLDVCSTQNVVRQILRQNGRANKKWEDNRVAPKRLSQEISLNKFLSSIKILNAIKKEIVFVVRNDKWLTATFARSKIEK